MIRFAAASLMVATLTVAANTTSAQRCDGDCDGDGQITVDELVRMVNLVLGGGTEGCTTADEDLDGTITVDEVLIAVHNALRGCERLLPPGPDLSRLYPARFTVGFLPIPVAEPVALIAADLDGNGLTDLATANFGTGNLSLLLQQHNSGFARARNVRLGGKPSVLLAMELNHDGLVDLVAADSSAARIWIVLSSATPPARTVTSLTTAAVPSSLVAGDLDGDGKMDLVLGSQTSAEVFVLLGDGRGSFSAARGFEAADRVSALAAGDLNGDGRLDIVAAGEGTVAILFGVGDGSLEPPVAIHVDPRATVMRVADVSRDGAADLIALVEPATFDDHSTIMVLLGDGAGNFQPSAMLDAGAPSASMIVEDLDGDSNADIITGSDLAVTVLYATGDGAFTAPIPSLTSEREATALAVADIDADGVADLAYATRWNDDVSILWGLGDRRLAAEETVEVGGSNTIQALAGDLDGNGTVDVASVNALSNDVSILLNDGRGGFAAPILVAAERGLQLGAVGDLDGSQGLDLVTWSSHPRACLSCLQVFESLGDGRFAERRRLAPPGGISAMTVSDIDADGLGDIVLRTASRISTYRSLGNWTFTDDLTVADHANNDFALGDVNADGLPDLAISCRQRAEVLTVLSDRGQALARQARIPVPLEPFWIRIADLNGDATADILTTVATGDEGFLLPLFGNGDGTFEVGRRIFGVTGRRGQLADVNGDGLLDLVAVRNGTTIYPGLPGLIFGAPQNFAGHDGIEDLKVVDLDGDGAMDLLTATPAGFRGLISVIRGRGGGG